MVVTLLGWLTLIKGIALMVTPPQTLTAFYRALHYPERFRLFMITALVLSAWLLLTAFFA